MAQKIRKNKFENLRLSATGTSYFNPDVGNTEHNLDNVELGLKYANFTFEETGLLIGGGIELGLPTGDDDNGIGSDHVLEVEPFVDFGFKKNQYEIVGILGFGIPTNTNGEDEADWELGWNLSLLYHMTSKLKTLLEFDGESVYGGEEDEFDAINITPGIKFQATDNPNLEMGLGVSFPLSNDKDFHLHTILSLFYHF